MRTTLARGVSAVLAAADAVPDQDDLLAELGCVGSASGRGYFLPDEEELIRLRYAQYLSLRAALMETLGSLGGIAGRDAVEWRERLPVFTTAFAAACVLMRVDRFMVELAADRPVLWKKLDEAEPRSGIPRKSFTAIFKSLSDPVSTRRFLLAADFHARHRGEIRLLADDPEAGPVVALLEREEQWIERRRRDAVKRLVSYRRFSFVRRSRSAWKKVMFGFFEASGRAVAELRQPGIKAPGAPKRITAGLKRGILERVKPGDVFVTRHDDALSNLFLPGFWPHAALYLGTTGDLVRMGIGTADDREEGAWFLESKKDGVRIRMAEETLEVDALLVFRPPMDGKDLDDAIRLAASHEGKPYDFLFDFRTSDRMVCTEVVYRGFHGAGPVRFHLKEVGGRLCLPAEEFIDQAMACGFELVLTAGLRGDVILEKDDAREALNETRG